MIITIVSVTVAYLYMFITIVRVTHRCIPVYDYHMQLFGRRSEESVLQDEKWKPLFQSCSATLEQMVCLLVRNLVTAEQTGWSPFSC